MTIKNFTLFICIAVLFAACGDEPKESDKKKLYKEETTVNLEHALSGEGEANRKYASFAEIADKEGYPQVARLWRAASAAEGIHARNHMKVLGMLNSTKENLKNAVEGEQYEFNVMYPKFVEIARKAGRDDAAQSMEWAYKVERLHHEMFLADLKDLQEGKKPKETPYWVCSVCGNTVPGSPPEKCPICGAPKDKFFEVK